MTTIEELRQMLERITDETPDGAVFCEYSRTREKAYSLKSVVRWWEIIQLIERHGPVNRCLDIGTTPFTFALKHWCREVDTLDCTDAFKARCEGAGVKLYVAGPYWRDITVPDEYYDCIIFLEVIEHLRMNPEKVIALLKQKLRKGGILILSTPNLMCFGNRIKMLFNQKLTHFHYPAFARDEGDMHGFGHDRVYTPAEMRDYFQNTGWSWFELGYHGMPVADSVKSWPLGQQMIRLPMQLIKHLVPSTRQLMLVVAKK